MLVIFCRYHKTAMGVVKLLVQHKIDVNAVDRIGEVTALHVAAHRYAKEKS